MKKYYIVLVSLCAISLSAINANAQQCKLSLTADSGNCELPSILRLDADFGLYEIAWYYGGSLVQTYTRTWDTSGVGIRVAGGNGFGPRLNQFRPSDVEVDDSAVLYISDIALNNSFKNNRILKWGPTDTIGTIVADGVNSPTASNFKPSAIAFDKNRNFFLSDNPDTGNNRVMQWVLGAPSGTAYAGVGIGSAPNQFDNPHGICFDKANNLYVADAGNARIQMWSPGATSGTTFIVDTMNGFFQLIAMDLEDNLYVTDFNNNRILRYAPGNPQGIVVAGDPNGARGTTDSFLNSADGIYVDGLKNMYISDYANQRIQLWLNGASKGITIGGGHGMGTGANQLRFPAGIRQDKWGNVYVADVVNNRIQKYPPLPIVDTFVATQNGMYTVVVKAFNGCIITDSIEVSPQIDPAFITVNQFTLSTTRSYSSYQWLLNNELIPGATDSTYQVTENGDYKVVVTDARGCTDTSDVYPINNVAVKDVNNIGNMITIFPNPVQQTIHINAPVRINVIITDMYGKTLKNVQNAKDISADELSPGMYLLRIYDEQENLIKVKEFVKVK